MKSKDLTNHLPDVRKMVAGEPVADKPKLNEETNVNLKSDLSKDPFLEYLLNGPVYEKKDIKKIEENHKSIAAWRTEA